MQLDDGARLTIEGTSQGRPVSVTALMKSVSFGMDVQHDVIELDFHLDSPYIFDRRQTAVLKWESADKSNGHLFIWKEETVNKHEKEALAVAARDALSKLQRSQRIVREIEEDLVEAQAKLDLAQEKYDALKQYESVEDTGW